VVQYASTGHRWRLMLAVHVLETLAVAFLAWVTLD
jgi:hypothetical protein